MSTENVDLMRRARESLRGKWGLAIGTFVIYTVIMGVCGAKNEAAAISLLVGGSMALGAATFSLSISRNKEARLDSYLKDLKTSAPHW